MPFLYSNDLNLEDFLNVVKNFSCPKNTILMAFSPSTAYFDFFHFDKKLLALTDQGRIFFPEGELKWRLCENQIRTVYMGYDHPPGGLVDYSSKMEGLKPEISELILWGTRTDLENEWIEQRVPHRFVYPVTSRNYYRGRVALVIENWKDSSGLVKFSRYHSIKEIPATTQKTEDVKISRFLPYSLEKIEIENFQCIKKTAIPELPDRTQWVFLLGENGSGKTAFLQALTIAVCGPRNAVNILKEHRKNCRINVDIWEDEQKEEKTLYWDSKMWSWSGIKRPEYYCAYGPSRLEIQGDRSLGQEREDIDPEKSLLDQRGNLRNIERWIIGQRLREDSDSKARTRKENVIKVLKSLLPNVSEIMLEEDYLLFQEMGFWARIYEIASGHKSILAMVGDILIRFFEMQPKETDPKKLKGIVVIDELDVHIHPVYQREFPKLLSETFPLVQFICSTHSPIPLLGAPEGSRFFVVERDETNGTTVQDPGVDVSRLHPTALLTSPLFKLESLFSECLKDYADLDPEDDYNKIFERKTLEDKIEKASLEINPIPEDWLE